MECNFAEAVFGEINIGSGRSALVDNDNNNKPKSKNKIKMKEKSDNGQNNKQDLTVYCSKNKHNSNHLISIFCSRSPLWLCKQWPL